MNFKAPFIASIFFFGISECPSMCYCSKTRIDPSLLKTDCADRGVWLAPMGVSKNTTHLTLMENKIVSITRKYLSMVNKVKILDVSRNLIDRLTSGLFSELNDLEILDLSANQLGFIKEGIFKGLGNLTTLYLGENKISRLESRSFLGLPNLKHLWLHINRIWDLPHNIFHGLSQLKVLSLNMNKLTKLSEYLFRDTKSLEFLFMQHNEITDIPYYLFANSSSLRYVFLNNNNLTVIGPKTFAGASHLDILTLSNNLDLSDIEANSFDFDRYRNLSLIYILQTALVRIKMESFNKHRKVGIVISPTDNKYPLHVPDDERLRAGLERNGFECNGSVCTPCHFGTYQKRINNSFVCVPCPAGGFYQNTVGHFGLLAGRTGCLPCPRGTYVELDKVPGKRQSICRVCPAGSKTDQWSSYRGCFCIDSFYRRGRFSRCEACPKGVGGILCNETILVKEGYWWKFRDYNESWQYQRFVDALMVPDENYNPLDVDFTGEFPKAYPCPKAASCLGSVNSVRKPCQTGYGGPLCEVCDKGYHKAMSRCSKCPTLPWMVTQVSVISLVIFFLIFILVRDERKCKNRGRTLSDVVLARLKIVVGFYQVTAGTLDAFSYVQWPEALLQLSNYAKFLQLNLVQIAPPHCFRHSLRMNAYVGLLLTVALNGVVILLAFAFYQVKKTFITIKRKDMSEAERHDELSNSKEHCYRSAFLIMFITFPETSSRILRMLPPACQEICQDVAMKNCTYYLKMDYSIKCFDETYKKYVNAAYVGSAYPVLLPLFIVVVLYWFYYRPQIKNRDANAAPKRYAIVEGMRFLYENYSERCWYWEIVEIVRKLILTSGLALIGAEGRTYIGMAAMASGFYAVAHAQARPIPDKLEHLLQLASLVATFFNLSVGVLLRIPSEMVNYSIEKDKDSLGVTVLLVTANLLVTGLIVIRYLVSLGQSVYAVIKNPQCNWECCLSVILSMQDAGSNLTGVGGDIGGQDFKGNLAQGDDFAVPTMGNTVSDMGIFDLGVEDEGAEGNKEDANGKGGDIEIKSADRSGYDGAQSSGASRSPDATERTRNGIPRTTSMEDNTRVGSSPNVPKEDESPVEAVASQRIKRPIKTSLETPPDKPSKVREVKFKTGGRQLRGDLPAAASNKALVSNDVDIVGSFANEEHTRENEDVPKGEALFAGSTQASDDDEVQETAF